MTPLFRLRDPSFLMHLGYHFFLGLLNIYQFLITRVIIEREKKEFTVDMLIKYISNQCFHIMMLNS